MAEEYQKTYVQMLLDTLMKKYSVLDKIHQITKQQAELLSSLDFDEGAFDGTLERKGIQVRELERCDQSFEKVYRHVRKELQDNGAAYAEEGRQLQELIRECTGLGLQIEHLEQQNKSSFEQGLQNKRQTIRQFHVNHQAANTYYRNMANQHQTGNSYFLDKKK